MAKENLRKPHIREEIDRRLNDAFSGCGVTVEKVLRDLEATYVRATEAEKFSAAVRCLELQGKYLKMFTNKVEHVPTIDEFTTDELVALLREVIAESSLDIVQIVTDAQKDVGGSGSQKRLDASA